MAITDALKGPLAHRLAKIKSTELQEAEARKTDAMRQHEYAVARKSILGEFSSPPPSAIQRCIVDGKASRRKERLDLVDRVVVACPKHAPAAARLRQDMDEVENMRCAKHVYLANDPNAPADLRDNPPPGFKKATDKISAIRVKGEVLTKTQESLLGSGGLSLIANDAVGNKRDIVPSHGQNYFNQLKEDGKTDGKDSYDTYLHGMDEVIDSTEKGKTTDDAALKGCLGGKENFR